MVADADADADADGVVGVCLGYAWPFEELGLTPLVIGEAEGEDGSNVRYNPVSSEKTSID